MGGSNDGKSAAANKHSVEPKPTINASMLATDKAAADAAAAAKAAADQAAAEAAESAKSSLQLSSFSRQGLIDQLTSEYGEGFTREQAEYGVSSTGL